MARWEKVDDCGCVLERNEAGLHMVECPLHASARDLLGACEATLEANDLTYGKEPEYLRKCRQAVTKAKGGSL
jgi:hypothetical protein